MHRFTLFFDDPEVELAYRQSRVVRWATLARGTGLLALVWLALVGWAAVVVPADFDLVLRSVALWVLPVAVLLLVGTRLAPIAIRDRAIAVGGPVGSLFVGISLVVLRSFCTDPLTAAYTQAGVAVMLLILQVFVSGLFLHKQALSLAFVIIWEIATFGFAPITLSTLVNDAFWVSSGLLVGLYISYTSERLLRRVFIQRRTIEEERAKSDRLLRNMLPEAIAERLKRDSKAIADGFDAVTVVFADLVGFTPLAATLAPRQLVELLNEVFSAFDALAREHGMEKIKTIGDAYMVVSGLPEPRVDHARVAASMALQMRRAIADVADGKLQLRIGLHSGPVVAGVIGTSKYSYDLWGDTVNTASRMESHGAPGAIHVSEQCRLALDGAFELEDRGLIEIKGKGQLRTWWLGEKFSGV